MASTIQSIVAKLNLEMERQLVQLFPKTVRLHLLWQSNSELSLSTLQSRLDKVGQFVIIVYLKRGDVRGAYFGKDEQTFKKWFLFHLTSKEAISIPNQSEDATNEDLWVFGNAMKLQEQYQGPAGYHISVDFSSDAKFNTGWAQESLSSSDGSLKGLELYRVQEVGDLFVHPWRKTIWEESVCEKLRESFVTHKVTSASLNIARVLLVGPAGTGKSSFINSVRSVMYRRVLHLPIVGTAQDGFTRKLTSYAIRAERGGASTSLTLCDVPPIGDLTEGLSYSDSLALINGHVADGYKFDHENPISHTDPCYRNNPKMADRIHCVAFCLSALNVMDCSETQKKLYRKLHATFSALNIPQVILLTHVDRVCRAVNEDVSYVYSSVIVQERMERAAEQLGMPLSYVFPVKNYSWELTVNCPTDTLLLTAVQRIQEAVDDTLEDLGDTVPAGSSSRSTSHVLAGPQELTV